MFVKVAQRIGGFAGTTATRWISGAAQSVPVPDAVKSKPGIAERVARPALAATAGLAALAGISSSAALRNAVADRLRQKAEKIRASENGTHANGANGSKGLSEKTRNELYEMAKKADIAGRSQMTKKELERALSSGA
ncbi:MAG: Rho termination factor N-terminal domain-containing protein [Actinomycetota bacterium]|nr:Rho termination factor N-terminal domain-containing protein [Actinomycetota bacterium]